MKKSIVLLLALFLAGCAAFRPGARSAPASDSAAPASATGTPAPVGPASAGPLTATPPGAASTAGHLRITTLQMIDERTGWILGRLETPGQLAEQPALTLLRTTDSGSNWVDVSPAPALSCPLLQPCVTTAAFVDGLTGWVAMATAPTVANVEPSGNVDRPGLIRIARTADGGKTWAATEIHVKTWESGGLRLSFTNARDGWLLATSGPQTGTMYKSVFRTNDGGATWTGVSRSNLLRPTGGLPNREYVTGFTARNVTEAWVADLYRDNREVPLYNSADGGANWSNQQLAFAKGFEDAYYANAYAPVFFGPDGLDGILPVEYRAKTSAVVLYSTHDGGRTWEQGASPLTGTPYDPYTPFYQFVDRENGFVLLDQTLHITHDGGQTWTSRQQPLLQGGRLAFASAMVGWALTSQGRLLYKTTDGGQTWSPATVAMPAAGKGQ